MNTSASITLLKSEKIDANHRLNDSVSPALAPTRERIPSQTESENETESNAPIQKPRRSRKPLLFAVAALVILAIAGKFAREWWTVGRFVESTDDAYVGGDVTVIAPKVSGFISQLAVTDNQEVHAGDLLLKLDDRDYKAALAKAAASVANRQAAITNLDALHFLQEAVIVQAEAEIAAADAEIQRSSDDQTRYRNLRTNGAVSVQSLQKAEADYQQALAAGTRTRAGLTAAKRQLSVLDAQKLEAQAALEQAVADRELAQLNLSYTELRSPINGRVGNRSAQVGAYAPIGAQLISIVPAKGLWVDANFKESQIARMQPGLKASVKLDVSGRVFNGHVASIAPATGAQFSVLPPENATGNFTKIVQRVAVRIVLDDEVAAQEQLRPGLSVTASVDGREIGKGAL